MIFREDLFLYNCLQLPDKGGPLAELGEGRAPLRVTGRLIQHLSDIMAQGITTYNYGILRPSGDIMFGPWAAYFPVYLWQGCEIIPMFAFSGVLISDMRCAKSTSTLQQHPHLLSSSRRRRPPATSPAPTRRGRTCGGEICNFRVQTHFKPQIVWYMLSQQ